MDSTYISKRHYIKDTVVKNVEMRIAMIFMLFYFVFPQYFGFQISGFDMTLQRIVMIVSVLFLLEDRIRIQNIAKIIYSSTSTKYILIYLAVTLYTAIMLNNINSFMGPFIDFICMYLVIYFIKYDYGVEKFIHLIKKYAYLLCFLGLLEYVMQKSLFSYMLTLPNLYAGEGIRSGSYRIMGPCNHSLGYGLLLITIVPCACVDLKNNIIDLFSNKLLFILLIVNVLLTGSRSTLAVLILELALIVIFTPKAILRRTLCYLFLGILGFFGCIIITYKVPFSRYVLMQTTSIIDEIVGTKLAVNFGADVKSLGNSTNYRRILLRLFDMNLVKPYLGGGPSFEVYLKIDGFYIHSIDNFYIAHYLRYAYPGLITYLIFIITVGFRMLIRAFREHSGICIAVLIGSVCYFINLWWLDTLQTIKYVYILFAIFEALPNREKLKFQISK